MKKLIIGLCLLVAFISCERGSSSISLNGDEPALPPELKGLRIYNVTAGTLDNVRVAVLNNQVNSVTYQVGKTTSTTIILNGVSGRTIECKEIISETDEIIVIRKK